LFSITTLCSPPSLLFPYTTLFRSSTSVSVIRTFIWVLVAPPPAYAPSLFHSAHHRRAERPDRAHPVRRAHHSGSREDSRSACARDRKSTRLNSSHRTISYAVFCLK